MEPLHTEDELVEVATRITAIVDFLEKDILQRPCKVSLCIDLQGTYIAAGEAMTVEYSDTGDEQITCFWMLNHDDQVGHLIVQAFRNWKLLPPTAHGEVCQFHLRTS